MDSVRRTAHEPIREMYGPNYSGFAFHPKAVRMVGSVYFAAFSTTGSPTCDAEPTPTTLLAVRSTSLRLCKNRLGKRLARATHNRIDACDRHTSSDATPCAHPLFHRISACWTAPYPPRCDASSTCAENLICRHPIPPRHTDLPTIPSALIPGPRPIATPPNPTNKNGVFHVKHAARFPPTASTIKLFSSPTRGTFRSRADSAQAPPPALPAQTHPSPAHNRNRRFAMQPVRSARSAASPHPYCATR